MDFALFLMAVLYSEASVFEENRSAFVFRQHPEFSAFRFSIVMIILDSLNLILLLSSMWKKLNANTGGGSIRNSEMSLIWYYSDFLSFQWILFLKISLCSWMIFSLKNCCFNKKIFQANFSSKPIQMFGFIKLIFM